MLENVEEAQWWKLFIDKEHHNNGSEAYDKDQSRGHKNAMMQTFRKALIGDIGKKLNFDIYDGYHRKMAENGSAVVDDARNMTMLRLMGESLYQREINSPNYRVKFSNKKVVPNKVLQEMANTQVTSENNPPRPLLSEHKEDDPVCLLNNDHEHNNSVIKTNYTKEDKPKLVNNIFESHYNSMLTASTDSEKLEVIAGTVSALHVMHPYVDGNGRLNMPIIMNKMLIDEGLMPSILPDGPAVFGGLKTKEELAKDMVVGMRDFINQVKKVGALTENDDVKERLRRLESLEEIISKKKVEEKAAELFQKISGISLGSSPMGDSIGGLTKPNTPKIVVEKNRNSNNKE